MGLGLGSKITKGSSDLYNKYRSRHSVRFDGTDDHMLISDSTTFDHVGSDSQFTISCWFKVDGLGIQNQALMSKFNGSGNKREWLLYLTAANKMYLAFSSDGAFETDGGGDDTGVHNIMKKADDSADWVLEDTKWHHILVSYNGAPSQKINWFLDGVTMKNNDDSELTNGNFSTLNQDDASVMIGAYGDGTSYPFLGYIADPIYVNTLVAGASKAKYMYNNGKPRNLSRFIGFSSSFKRAYWQMGDNKNDGFELKASGITFSGDEDEGFIVDATNTKTLTADKTQGRGDFSSGAGWAQSDIDDNNFAKIENGVAHIKQTAGSNYTRIQLSTNVDGDAIFENGKLYELTVVCSEATAGKVRVMPTGDSGNQAYSPISAVGTYKLYFVGTFARNTTNNTDMKFSSVTVKEIESSDYALFKNMSKGIVNESPGLRRDRLSYNFDGTNDFVEITDNSSLDFGTSDFSISGWVKTTSTGAKILNKWTSGDGGLGGYFVYVASDGKFRARIDDGGDTANTNYVVNSGTTAINDGEWHHFAVVFDRSTDMRIYTDGVLETTDTNIPSVGDIDTSLNCFIGCNNSGSEDFDGNISDITVFNKALSLAEVRENMGPGLDLNSLSTEANIVAWWRFGDGVLDYKGTSGGYEGCLGDENNPTLGTDVLGGKGDFSDPSYWTQSAGQSIVENNKAKWLGGGSYGHIKKDGILTPGKIYEVIIDVNNNSGNGRVNLNFAPEYYPRLFSNREIGIGIKTYFKADHANFTMYNTDYDNTLTIDNLTVRLVNGIPGCMRNMVESDIQIDAP